MKRAKRSLAIVALATIFGCTNQTTTGTQSVTIDSVLLPTTSSTAQLVIDLSTAYWNRITEFETQIIVDTYSILNQKLTDGEIPFFISNHIPNSQEFWVIPLAQDGIAIILNQRNPIQQLSAMQLHRIFQGSITNWQEVGGIDLPITVVTREQAVDIHFEFTRLIMGDHAITPNAQVVSSDSMMIQRIDSLPGGIGYIPISQLDPVVNTIAINGIAPNFQAIADNRYPLRYTIFFISRFEPETIYKDFLAWVQSPEGQAIITHRYVPLLP